MTPLNLIIIHLGFILWYYVGYQIGKTKFKKNNNGTTNGNRMVNR